MAPTLVRNLQEILDIRQTTLQLPFRSLHVADDGSAIQIEEHHDVQLDELAERSLAKHLGISANYLERCPGALKAANLNHWIGENREKDAVFTLSSTGSLIDVYSPEKRVVPVPRVGEMIGRVFDADDEIIMLHRDDKRLHVDIKVDTAIEVPGDGTDWRPEVGDITHGGVRLYLPADLSEGKPTIEPYLFRLVCSNGMSQMSDNAVITLKGKTVPDIIDEMEERAQEVLGNLPATLGDYASLADIPVHGNLLQVIRSLGQEHNLSPRVISQVMDAALQISPDREPSLYDMAQAFTQVANGTVAYGTALALQRLGGHLVSTPSELESRCGTCSHLLRG